MMVCGKGFPLIEGNLVPVNSRGEGIDRCAERGSRMGWEQGKQGQLGKTNGLVYFIFCR